MKTLFSNIAKTKKGKIQLLTMALSTLLAIVFTIILIVFGAQQCKYDKPYSYKFSGLGQNISMSITLHDNNTYDAVITYNGELQAATGTYYIVDGKIYTKPSTETTYTLMGPISYYEISKEPDGTSTFNIAVKCENTITAKNVCITFLVLSLVAVASMIAWIVIEKYLKNRKPATQNVVSTPTENKEVETTQTETKEETVEEPKEVEKETTSTDTSTKE